LKGCPSCRQKLAEFKAITEAARKLPSLSVSDGFAEKVVKIAIEEKYKKEVAGKLRYRFSLASAAFAVAAIAVFVIFGPNSNTNINPVAQSTSHIGKALEIPDQPELSDFAEDPTIKVWSVPVPPEIREMHLLADDSLLLADSASKIDEFILPEVNNTKENVKIEF
jgi:hypothetical protein